jgi:hypothetical protein
LAEKLFKKVVGRLKGVLLRWRDKRKEIPMFNKLLLAGLIGMPSLTACSPSIPVAQNVPGPFQIQALTENYLERKVHHWLGQNDETALVRELEFARIKHPQLMEDIMHAAPSLYAQVVAVPAVQQRRSQAPFDAFMVRLARPPVISGYQVSTLATGISSAYSLTQDGVGNTYSTKIVNSIVGIKKITPEGLVSDLDYSSGTNEAPYSMAMHKATGNLFLIAAHRILKITPAMAVTVVAGTANGSGFNGDNIPAVTATLSNPYGIAVGNDGTIYFSDTNANRIRKISPDGIISTLAGTGAQTYGGDGGLAINARVSVPRHLTVDHAGQIYFSDFGNRRIRKIDAAGYISTVAGNGVNAYSGDGGPAIEAGLGTSWGIAIDGFGNLFITTEDTDNHRIRKVDTDGTITTIAGEGPSGNTDGEGLQARFNRPRGILVDATNTVYVADYSNFRIRKLTPQYAP